MSCVIANFWDKKIRPATKEFVVKTSINDTTTIGSVMQWQTTTQVGFLSWMLERGLFSGQIYMAEGCNHRDIDVTQFTSHEPSNPCSMVQSMLEAHKDEKLQFDKSGNKIGLYLHSVHDDTKGGAQSTTPLRSGMKLHYNHQSHYAVAKFRTMKQLSARDFQRLLQIFDQKWEPSTPLDGPVSHDLIISYLDLFAKHEFDTVDHFKAFLDAFNMGSIFAITPGDDIYTVHWKFGICIRSLTPVRGAAYDGQHRWTLEALFITGFFRPAITMPLVRSGEKDFPWKDIDQGKLQVWMPQRVNIGIPYHSKKKKGPRTSLNEIRQHLVQCGNLITETNNICIDTTWNEVVTKLYQKCNVDGMMTLDYNGYWCQQKGTSSDEGDGTAAFRHNAKALANAFIELLMNVNRFQKLARGASTLHMSKILSAISEMMEKSGNMVSKDNTQKGDLPVMTGVMLMILRAQCHTQATRDEMLSFFQPSVTHHPQRGTYTTTANAMAFRDPSWLRQYVHSTAITVQTHVEKRYLMEWNLIEWLRRTSSTDALKKQLKDAVGKEKLVIPEFMDVTNLPSPKSLEIMSREGIAALHYIKGKSSTTLRQRVNYASYHGTVNDMISTVVEYGFDPDFFLNPVHATPSTSEKKTEMEIFEEFLTKCVKELEAQDPWIDYEPVEGKPLEYTEVIGSDGDDEMEDDSPGSKSGSKTKHYMDEDLTTYIRGLKINNKVKDRYEKSLRNVVAREYLRSVKTWCNFDMEYQK